MALHTFSIEVSSEITAIATCVTFLALVWYAWLTREIAKAAIAQAKAANIQAEDMETPFLALVNNREDKSDQSGELALMNQGKGPAINITYTGYRDGSKGDIKSKPLGPGGMRALGSFTSDNLKTSRSFTVRYQSLSGNWFISHVTYSSAEDDYEVSFKRCLKTKPSL